MNMVYYLLIIALLSLIFPAWIVSKQAYPSFKVKGFPQSFSLWFLTGFFWIALALALHAFIMVMSILNTNNELLSLLNALHTRLIFSAWLPHCAIGGILWISNPSRDSVRVWRSICIVFNSVLIAHLVMPLITTVNILFGIVASIIWFLTVKQAFIWFKKKGDMASLMVLSGILIGGAGGIFGLAAAHISHRWALWGIHLWVVGGGVMISVGLMFHVLEKITGLAMYSKKTGLLTLIILSLWGPWSSLTMSGNPSAIGTVMGVGLGFTGLLIGINVWMAFSSLKQKTIDELSARWVSLGAWLPAGITIQFISFGAWCFFIGSFLYVVSSFQNFSVHLMPTLWQEGLIKLSVLGGAGSFYIAAVYCAFSEQLSTPDNQIAELGYWHYMGGSILMWICLCIGGIVLAAQRAVAVPDAAAAVWQRPFQAGAAVADIMIFASFLVLIINLFRAGNAYD